MAKTSTVKLDTGKYLIKGTPWMAVCEKPDAIWHLKEVESERIVATTTSKRACMEEAERRLGAGATRPEAPPLQDVEGVTHKTRVTICKDLADLLENLKPSRPGHHYVVLEVSDA